MAKNYILFIDSGLGGLTTLHKSLSLTQSNYIYFADDKNSPYGNKSSIFLKHRLSEIVSYFSKKYKLCAVVLACNTATTNTISFLRKNHPNLVFIGTEPASKLALKLKYSHPTIIATNQTINRLKPQICNVFKLIKCKNLARDIEHFIIHKDILSKYRILSTVLSIKQQTKKQDCIVLGCTHYPLISQIFEKYIHIPLLDGNDGVARQIARLCPQNQDFCKIKIILSSQNCKLKEKYKKILKQILANQLNLC